jgi:hypothetical protein
MARYEEQLMAEQAHHPAELGGIHTQPEHAEHRKVSCNTAVRAGQQALLFSAANRLRILQQTACAF